MDSIRATPMQYPTIGLLSDKLKEIEDFVKRSYAEHGVDASTALNLLGIPAVQQTAERIAYGEPLTTGKGMTTQVRPEVMEAAMTLLPVAGTTAKAGEKAAMAAGRAGERYAEKVIPQIMERGGVPASLLDAMSSKTISPMDVWHGSPHGPFTKFDATKVGSGEGGSMYGVGTNLAESPSFAQGYRELLSGDESFITVNGAKDTSDIAKMIGSVYQGDAEKAVKTLESKIPLLERKVKSASKDELLPGLSDFDMADMELQALLKKVDEAKNYIGKEVKQEKPGYLYKVDLPDDGISKMINLDKPMKDQSTNVKEYFGRVVGRDFDNDAGWSKMSGSNALEAVRDRLGLYKGDFERELSKQGIPGVEYRNDTSGLAKGSSNFVVYPGGEDLLTIKSINDNPVNGLLSTAKQEPAQSLLETAKPKARSMPMFETGKEITFPFIKNTEKSPKVFGMGQEIEPAGNYISSGHDVDLKNLPEKWISGEISFNNPLVIDWGQGLYSDPDNWKNVLSKQYGGKTGKSLSKAIAKDGYDGIVTMNKYGPSEIVDLSMFKKKTNLLD